MSQQTSLSQADIAAILGALRAEVRARRVAQGRLEPTPLERDMQRSLDEIELHRVISAHWPLIGHSLPQRAIALINKLVRRALRWYINPIVEQQNAYNDAVARALRLLADAYLDLGEQIAERRRMGDGSQGMGDGRRETGDERHDAGTGLEAEDGSAPPADAAARPQPPTPSFQLQALVQARAAGEPPARFPDLALSAQAPQLRLREQVSAHWPLGGATLPQRAVALVNKLVRRYLRWYINPIVEQQNAANAATTAALLAIIQLDAERRAEVAALRAKR